MAECLISYRKAAHADMVLGVKMTDLAVYVFRYGVAGITVQVSSEGYLCVRRVGKAIMRSFRSLRSYLSVAFETVSKCLIDDGAFKKGRRGGDYLFNASR